MKSPQNINERRCRLMYHSIQHFVENVIPELEKIQKFFVENPSRLEECAVRVKQIMLGPGCWLLSEMVEECNTMLKESRERREHWQIKDRCVKHLLTSLGTISFTHTRFSTKPSGKRLTCWTGPWGLAPTPVSARMPWHAFWRRRPREAMKKRAVSQEGREA